MSFKHWNISELQGKIKLRQNNLNERCQLSNNDTICFYSNYLDANKLNFSNIRASDSGTLSFLISSNAFEEKISYHVESSDFAKTWQYREEAAY